MIRHLWIPIERSCWRLQMWHKVTVKSPASNMHWFLCRFYAAGLLTLTLHGLETWHSKSWGWSMREPRLLRVSNQVHAHMSHILLEFTEISIHLWHRGSVQSLCLSIWWGGGRCNDSEHFVLVPRPSMRELRLKWPRLLLIVISALVLLLIYT